jgi:hypothetical protein
LPAAAKDAVRRVRLHHADGGHTGLLNSLAVYTAPAAGQLQNWTWKSFDEKPDFSGSVSAAAEGAGAVVAKPVLLVPTPVEPNSAVRSFQPRWFAASFARPACNRSLFFQPGSMHKGQLYLNGRNAGRFWVKRATQTHYYLPESWLRDRNELLIFEEQGLPPIGAALSWKEGGPWGEIEVGGMVKNG